MICYPCSAANALPIGGLTKAVTLRAQTKYSATILFEGGPDCPLGVLHYVEANNGKRGSEN